MVYPIISHPILTIRSLAECSITCYASSLTVPGLPYFLGKTPLSALTPSSFEWDFLVYISSFNVTKVGKVGIQLRHKISKMRTVYL